MTNISAYFEGGPYDGQQVVTDGQKRYEVYERAPLQLDFRNPAANVTLRSGFYERTRRGDTFTYAWKGWQE